MSMIYDPIFEMLSVYVMRFVFCHVMYSIRINYESQHVISNNKKIYKTHIIFVLGTRPLTFKPLQCHFWRRDADQNSLSNCVLKSIMEHVGLCPEKPLKTIHDLL